MKTSQNCSLYNEHIHFNYDVIVIDAKQPVTDQLVTLVTQLTWNRFESVKRMALKWRGPMSVAFYVTSSNLLLFQGRVQEWVQTWARDNIAVQFMLHDGVSY